MAAHNSFSRCRHLQHACPGDLRTLEALVNGKTEHERITICEAAFHLREHPIDPLIIHRAEFLGIGVTRLGWFLPWLCARRPEVSRWISRCIVVRPLRFRTGTLLGDALYAVANLCAVIDRHAMLNSALVVINE